MRNTFNISFGFWILILPFLGIPLFWKTVLISASGGLLILVGAGPSILKVLKEKPKTQKKKPLSTKQDVSTNTDIPGNSSVQDIETEKSENESLNP